LDDQKAHDKSEREVDLAGKYAVLFLAVPHNLIETSGC